MGLRLRFASSSVSLRLPNNNKVSIKLSSVELQLFLYFLEKIVSAPLTDFFAQFFVVCLVCLFFCAILCVCVCFFLWGGGGGGLLPVCFC